MSRVEWDIISAYRAVFWAYACFGLVKSTLGLCLSTKCEVQKVDVDDSTVAEETEPLIGDTREDAERSQQESPPKKQDKSAFGQMTKHTWATLFKLLPLFAVDSFASGLVPL